MDKKKTDYSWKEFLVLCLASVSGTAVIYLFQVLSSLITIFLAIPFDKTATLNVVVFVLIFALGLTQLAFLFFARINSLSLRTIGFLVKEGQRPRFLIGITAVFLCSLISMLMGLNMGGEAPSVYLGGAIFGFLFYLFFKKFSDKRKIIETSLFIGSGVGFGLAFQNPLAGLLIGLTGTTLKEIDWKRGFETLFACLMSYGFYGLLRWMYFPIKSSDWVGNFFYLGYRNEQIAPFSQDGYLLMLLLPGFCLLAALLYVLLIGTSRKLLVRDSWWSYFVSLGLVTLVGGLMYLNFGNDVIGSGSNIILDRSWNASLGIVFSLLGLRLMMTILSFNSHFFGGMVVPTLAMGALVGEAFSGIMVWSDTSYATSTDLQLLVGLGMIAFYAFVSAKPFVSFALIFSFYPIQEVILPSLALMVPILLVIKFSGWQGLSSLLMKIDEEDDVSFFHKRTHIRNFIRI